MIIREPRILTRIVQILLFEHQGPIAHGTRVELAREDQLPLVAHSTTVTGWHQLIAPYHDVSSQPQVPNLDDKDPRRDGHDVDLGGEHAPEALVHLDEAAPLATVRGLHVVVEPTGRRLYRDVLEEHWRRVYLDGPGEQSREVLKVPVKSGEPRIS